VAVRRAAGDARGRRRRQRGARVRARIDVRSIGGSASRPPSVLRRRRSPLALATSSVFLPYAPTTLLNLLFAVAYLGGASATGRSRSPGSRASRSGSPSSPGRSRRCCSRRRSSSTRWFGSLSRSGRWRFCHPSSGTVRRHGFTALFGTRFRRRHLARTTPAGPARPSPSRTRRSRRWTVLVRGAPILGHSEEEYTLELALRSNGYALWYLATRWVVAGPLGTLLAFAGGGLATRRWLSGRRALAEGTAAWNLSPNGASSEPRGSCSPVSSSPSSSGTSSSGDEQPPRDALGPDQRAGRGFRTVLPLRSPRPAVDLRWRRRRRRRRGLSRLRVWLAASGHARICAGDRRRGRGTRALRRSARCRGCGRGPLSIGTRRHTPTKYEAAYEPIESASFDDDLVFVPTPYGEWLQHPFQSLRNDPGWGGGRTRSTATRPRISR